MPAGQNDATSVLLQRFLHGCTIQRVPRLQHMNAQHRRQCVSLTAGTGQCRIVQLDQCKRLLQRNDLPHFVQQDLATRLLELIKLFRITEHGVAIAEPSVAITSLQMRH